MLDPMYPDFSKRLIFYVPPPEDSSFDLSEIPHSYHKDDVITIEYRGERFVMRVVDTEAHSNGSASVILEPVS